MRTYNLVSFDAETDFTDVRTRKLNADKIGITIENDRTPRHSSDRYTSEKTFWLNRKMAKKLYKELKKALKES